MIDDCLVLLDYVSKHPIDNQTYDSLSTATGIPLYALKKIFIEARTKYDSILARTATKYQFDFEVYTGYRRTRRFRREQILWARYNGYNHPVQ